MRLAADFLVELARHGEGSSLLGACLDAYDLGGVRQGERQDVAGLELAGAVGDAASFEADMAFLDEGLRQGTCAREARDDQPFVEVREAMSMPVYPSYDFIDVLRDERARNAA